MGEAYNFFKVYLNKEKRWLTIIMIVGILFIAPFLIMLLLAIFDKANLKVHFFNIESTVNLQYFLALWFGFIGIFVSMRIYYEVKEKARNLKELLRLILEMLYRAKNNHEVFMILPTPFLGYLLFLKDKNKFYKKYKSIINNLEKLTIAFLGIDIDKIKSIIKKIENTDDVSKKQNIFFDEIIKGQNELIKFHCREFYKEFPTKNGSDETISKYFHEFVDF